MNCIDANGHHNPRECFEELEGNMLVRRQRIVEHTDREMFSGWKMHEIVLGHR